MRRAGQGGRGVQRRALEPDARPAQGAARELSRSTSMKMVGTMQAGRQPLRAGARSTKRCTRSQVGQLHRPELRPGHQVSTRAQIELREARTGRGRRMGRAHGEAATAGEQGDAINDRTSLGSLACRSRLRCTLALGAGAGAGARQNAIEAISANQQGSNVIVKIAHEEPPAKLPIGFSITNPARIALDFRRDTANGTGKTRSGDQPGRLRSVNVVQAGERTRLVLNLKRPLQLRRPRSTATPSSSPSKAPAAWPRAVNASGLPALRREAARRRQAPIARHRFPPRPRRRGPHRGRPARTARSAVDMRQQGTEHRGRLPQDRRCPRACAAAWT